MDWFLPGQQEPKLVEYKGYRFSAILGYDCVFPELTRCLVIKGVQVLFHLTNQTHFYCPRAMVSRSIENRIFTATASRVGEERGKKFVGGSQVTDPRGHILLQMGKEEIGVSWVDIDPEVADDKSISKRNDLLKDRRPELYKEITKI